MTKTTEEKIAIMQHYVDGGEVEVVNRSIEGRYWNPAPAPSWDWSVYDYRIALRQSTVDWSQVGDRIIGFLTTSDGRSFGVTDIPKQQYDDWSTPYTVYPADLFPSFKPGNMHWRESLIVRPGNDYH